MPKIVWPRQPQCIAAAWLRHHPDLPGRLQSLLSAREPPMMTAQVAKAFLRCFYAARDLDRAERDAAAGGPATEAFAAATVQRRVAQLEQAADRLLTALAAEPPG